MANETITKRLFKEAKRYIPGGVNSPVRSFKGVGGYPIFIKKAYGCKFFTEDNRELIDYCLSWGALILGHAHPEVIEALDKAIRNGTSFGTATTLETELARMITEAMPSVEQIRLTNSGTEATMSAIRLARAYTKRDNIIKFEGAYHGHADYLLAKPGSGALTFGIPGSLGVPHDFTKHTIVLSYNDIEKAEEAVKRYKNKIAAIIVEPVMANCGLILPKQGFLKSLRAIADRYGILLIFDEVITGFRLSYGGAQEFFNIKADLTCLGKIIGAGLPIGAFGGRKDIMRLLAPEGGVYQAGTLSGNPIAVTAGITTLKLLKEEDPYKMLADKTERLSIGIESDAKKDNIRLKVNRIASMFSIFFTDKEVIDYKTARTQDTGMFRRFYHSMLDKGIHLSPSGFETNFLSIRHTDKDIDKTLRNVFAARVPCLPAGRPACRQVGVLERRS